jgi:hypothetical protein
MYFITMKTRIDLVKFCIEKQKSQSYLELGVHMGACFDQINVPYKIGVDIKPGSSRGVEPCTTDEFFAQNKDKFDTIFIDANHSWPYASRDVQNSLKILNEGGLIICHDCSPDDASYASDENKKCGNFYKWFCWLRTQPDVNCAVGNFDHGCGIIKQQPNEKPIILPKDFRELTYEDLETNRKEWLRLMSWDEITNWI